MAQSEIVATPEEGDELVTLRQALVIMNGVSKERFKMLVRCGQIPTYKRKLVPRRNFYLRSDVEKLAEEWGQFVRIERPSRPIQWRKESD
jgi:hypothetical protein